MWLRRRHKKEPRVFAIVEHDAGCVDKAQLAFLLSNLVELHGEPAAAMAWGTPEFCTLIENWVSYYGNFLYKASSPRNIEESPKTLVTPRAKHSPRSPKTPRAKHSPRAPPWRHMLSKCTHAIVCCDRDTSWLNVLSKSVNCVWQLNRMSTYQDTIK